MTLEEINKELADISSAIQGLSEQENAKIEELANQVDSLINADEGAIFNIEGIDFKAFIESNVKELSKFDKGEYFKKLNAKDSSKRIDNATISNDRADKIEKLVSKIERIGKLDTVLKKVQEKYDEKNFDTALQIQDSVNKSKIDIENDRVIKLTNFIETMEDDFKTLDCFEEVKKLESKNNEIQNEVTKLNNDMAGIPDPVYKDIIQKEIDEKNEEINSNKSLISEKNAIIGGRTAEQIKSEIKSRIPDTLNKLEVVNAIDEDNPREALNKLISKSNTKIQMYQNRINKNSERTNEINVAKQERINMQSASPISFNREDYPLSDDELEEIDNQIAAGGEKIDMYKQEATKEFNSFPVTTKTDLRREVKDWLNDGTKNPLKKFANYFKSFSNKSKESYKESKIKELVKGYLEYDKQLEKYNDMIEGKLAESKAKTKILDNRENSWKRSVREAALKQSNAELDNIIKEGNYGEIASRHYSKVINETTKEDDNSFIH